MKAAIHFKFQLFVICLLLTVSLAAKSKVDEKEAAHLPRKMLRFEEVDKQSEKPTIHHHTPRPTTERLEKTKEKEGRNKRKQEEPETLEDTRIPLKKERPKSVPVLNI